MKKMSVSQKVYADICGRISSALKFSSESVRAALAMVDDYLEGRELNTTNRIAALAFNMIKVELDRAMERSRRARQRALERKKKQANSIEAQASEVPVAMAVPEPLEKEETQPDMPIGISRRERRARERAEKKLRRKRSARCCSG